MPQSAARKPSQSLVRPQAQPLPDIDPAETQDHEYALVSVLYHALQGVQACEQYVGDAERAGDDDLVKFFQECVQEQQQRAARAKQLLVSRVDVDEEDEDEEDDDDDDDESEDDDEA